MARDAADAPDAYSASLDRIFESFLARRPARIGRHDREVRDPSLILEMARRHGLLPAPIRTLKITGSKGKGTVARLVADWLGAQGVGPVGLFVSPNEIDQVDRMRIDGRPIGYGDFVRLYERFAAELDRAVAGLPEGGYLSPFGVFLLLALAWFKERGVRWFVLEAGRGAAYDEVGRLPADIAVVTSLFVEHADQIGPTLGDIARNKMAIGDGAADLVLGPDVPSVLAQTGLPVPPAASVVARRPYADDLPWWCGLDRDIAEAAGGALLDRNGIAPKPISNPARPVHTASFGRTGYRGLDLVYDGSIAFDAFDRAYFERLIQGGRRTTVLLCLSDQKSLAPFLAYFEGHGVSIVPVVLDGLDLHSFARLKAWAEDRRPAATIGFTDAPALRALLDGLVAERRADLVYAIGLQPFLRLLKQALPAA